MKRRLKWMGIVVAGSVMLVAFTRPAEKYFEIAKSLDIYATLFKEVNAYYVDEVDPQKLVRTSIDGMLESLDPYTDFIAEDELESFRINTTGQYGGIGAYIGIINDRIVVTHPYLGYPASEAGLKVGDEIIAVDGKSMVGKTTSDVSNALKGQPHTDVELKIHRPGKSDPITFKIKRKRINIKNVVYAGIVSPGVGYIKLDDFTPGASREIADALELLKDKGAQSLILDLRDNPGGLLHEAVNIVGLFLPKGSDVVSTKGKVTEWNKNIRDLKQPARYRHPDGSAYQRRQRFGVGDCSWRPARLRQGPVLVGQKDVRQRPRANNKTACLQRTTQSDHGQILYTQRPVHTGPRLYTPKGRWHCRARGRFAEVGV
ncbi:MAG: PDZ domain-containing protein [Bacteroidia bacterium]|nr:PDZ domain-containing protein [Bacteroidia bacterium]